jgi:CheY-like chemotaxis protein
MRLRGLLVADPVESVARQIADGCERLAEDRLIATTGAKAIDLGGELRPEMAILSLELAKPEAIAVATDLRRSLPDTFIVITFRELTVPVMERLGRLGVDDFMPQPLDLTGVFRVASRHFGVAFRRHDRHPVTVDVQRADGVLIGRTLDLSEGGMRFSAIHPVSSDDSLLVDLMVPGASALRVRCRILEVEGKPPMPVTARAKFDNLRGRDHERLAAYLAAVPRV